jgi:hypothetical protein
MKPRHGFVPSALGQLESRVVLSKTTLGLSVVTSGLSPRLRVLNREQQALTAEVQQAFASFNGDYDQARASYFASIQSNPTAASSAITAFTDYTQQRTSLLAQQLISSFVQTPQGIAKAPGQPPALQQLIESKIIGPPRHGSPTGSLYKSLLATIPQPGVDAPTESLYSLSQDNAIQTAETAILNGVSIIKNGAFGIAKVQHY